MGRAVIGVARSDHDLGKICTIGGHDAVCHKAPEAVCVDHGAYDVLAIDCERSHVLCGGSAWLVHLRRVQGVDTNTTPVNEKRAAIDRGSFARNDRLLRLAGLGPSMAGPRPSRRATAHGTSRRRQAHTPHAPRFCFA